MSSPDKSRRKLKDLRVADLKHELEKRNLDSNGIKTLLAQRLEQAIVAEGHDPHDFWFFDKLGTEEHDDGKHNSAAEHIGEAPNNHRNSADTYVRSDSAQDRNRHEDSPNQNEHIEERNAGDLLVHDEEEESDFLTDSGRRNHNHPDAMASASPALGVDLPAESGQNAASSNGNGEHGKESNGDAGEDTNEGSEQRRRHGTEETEDELNRSRDYRSDRSNRDSPDEVAKSKNLWISNLPSRIKAAELKEMVMSYGPADGAKIIVSSKTPESPYGYVTMATIEAADECVKAMNGTEWHGKTIKVKKIARDPSGPGGSSNQNDSENDTRGRGRSRRSGDSYSARRIAASDRRRLGAKGSASAGTAATPEDNENANEKPAGDAGEAADAPKQGGDEKDSKDANAAPVRDLEYYKRKVRRDADYIRELEATVERNRRRHNFQLQREREKGMRMEQQHRKEIGAMRRERDLLSGERDLLDKRRSDLDRLEKSLLDRERMVKDRERHLEEKEREVMSILRSRQPTSMTSSGYGASQSGNRYYNQPAAPISSSASAKRPYQSVDVDNHGSSSWGSSGKRAMRNDYPAAGGAGGDRRGDSQISQQSSYASYRGGNASSGGGRSRGDYEDRSSYNSGIADSGSYGRSRVPGGSSAGAGGGRWADRGGVPSSGGVNSSSAVPSSVGHWVKPTSHRPPFVAGDVEPAVGDSWSRGSAGMGGMPGGARRF